MKTIIAKVSFLFLIALLQVSCHEKSIPDKPEAPQKKGRFQRYYYPGTQNLMNGRSTSKYDSTHIAFEFNYREGLLDSVCTVYHRTGQVDHKIEFKNGLVWNMIEAFDENGNALDWGNLKNGNGTVKQYDPRGKLQKSGEIVNGLMEGEWLIWANSGKVIAKEYYHDGMLQGTDIINLFF